MKWRLLVVLLFIFLATLGVGCWWFFGPEPKTAASPEVLTALVGISQADESKPDHTFVWQGSDGDPKYVRLPTISAEGYIVPVGIDSANAVAAPTNVHIAGWFSGSSLPGEKGLSVIDGHVSGPTQDGIFKNLGNLQKGDEFFIENGGSSVVVYKVETVQTYAASESLSYLFSQEPTIKSQLNLVTCGGEYDNASQSFNKRVIVTSRRIK